MLLSEAVPRILEWWSCRALRHQDEGPRPLFLLTKDRKSFSYARSRSPRLKPGQSGPWPACGWRAGLGAPPCPPHHSSLQPDAPGPMIEGRPCCAQEPSKKIEGFRVTGYSLFFFQNKNSFINPCGGRPSLCTPAAPGCSGCWLRAWLLLPSAACPHVTLTSG